MTPLNVCCQNSREIALCVLCLLPIDGPRFSLGLAHLFLFKPAFAHVLLEELLERFLVPLGLAFLGAPALDVGGPQGNRLGLLLRLGCLLGERVHAHRRPFSSGSNSRASLSSGGGDSWERQPEHRLEAIGGL